MIDWSTGRPLTRTDCTASGASGQRGSCSTNNDFQTGYGCFTTSGGDMCLRWCKLPSGSECAGLTGVSGGSATCTSTGSSLDGVQYGDCL